MSQSRKNGQTLTPVDTDVISAKQRNVKMRPTGQVIITSDLSPYTAIVYDDYIPVDSSGGAITVKLPLSTGAINTQKPCIGDQHTIVDATGSGSTHAITVDGNGANINADGAAPATTVVLSTDYAQATFTYIGPFFGWMQGASSASSSANAILEGGNSFGAPFVIGSLDAQPVTINVLGAAGTVNLGTGATGLDAFAKTVNVGTGAAAKTVTVGSGNTTSTLSLLGGTGAGAVAVTASTTGAITITSGAGGSVNIATAVAAQTVTIGNSAGATSISVASGTGGISLLTATSGNLSLATGTTGAISVVAGTAGTLTMSGGTASGAVNIATDAAARTVTIGNVTGATGVAINAGTNGVLVTATGAGNVRITPGATGNVQLNNAAQATCGVQLGVPVAVTDKAAGGSIGANTVTVDIASVIEVNQTTAAQTLTVPNPTVTTQARLLYVINIGSADFTMLASTVKAIAAGSKSMTCLIWSPGATRWVPTVIT